MLFLGMPFFFPFFYGIDIDYAQFLIFLSLFFCLFWFLGFLGFISFPPFSDFVLEHFSVGGDYNDSYSLSLLS